MEEFSKNIYRKWSVKVVFCDVFSLEPKEEIVTEINGTPESIIRYYAENTFNFGDSEEIPHDLMLTGYSVYFIEADKTAVIKRKEEGEVSCH